jgi:uncharacterized protein YndB with AHSA1/START domain
VKVEREIHIDVEPDRVYDLVMDPSRLEEWVTIHEELKEAPSGQLRKGSELVQRLKLAHRRFNVHWKVAEADRPTKVVWEGQGPVHSKAKVAYEFAPNGQGTTFRYLNQFDLPFGPLGKVAGATVRRASVRETDRSIERLKQLLEG